MDSTQTTFNPSECFTALASLPGVVVYQRVVTPDERFAILILARELRISLASAPRRF